MKERHTFVGKLLQKISKTVPDIMQVVGDLTGIDALERAGELISGDKSITPQDKESLLEELKMAKEIEIARLKDIADSRDLQKVALKQEDLFSKRFVYYIASFWSIIGAAFIFTILFVDIPDDSVRLVDTILGFLLGTIVASIITYFFGSSKGSSDKNDIITKLKGIIK